MTEIEQLTISRRQFCRTATAGLALAAVQAAVTIPAGVFAAEFKGVSKLKTIYVVPTWQYRNIGDIAHPFGIACLLKKHIPEARILMRGTFPGEVGEMFKRHLPDVQLDAKMDPQQADLLITSSGPMLFAQDVLRSWADATDKPFGVYGVSVHPLSEADAKLMSKASLFYLRDTDSLARARDGEHPVQCNELGFVPDAVFGFDLLDEHRATAFLKQHDLREHAYLCVIPRLRKSPPGLRLENGPFADYEGQLGAIMHHNRPFIEQDHAKLREAMIAWVRQTGMKVLLCPEMTYALDLMQPVLFDPLPDDVKPNVAIHSDWWMPDEAASIYKRAAALLSLDCHSPILACRYDVPALIAHDGNVKYRMWADIGLGEWCQHIDDTTGERLSGFILQIASDLKAARATTAAARERVDRRHRETMSHVRRLLELEPMPELGDVASVAVGLDPEP